MSNNPKPSPATWTVFISILTLILLLITAFDSGKFSFENGEISQMLYMIGFAVFLALIANWRRVNSKVNKVRSQIKFLFDIVIEYRRGHLEFIDKYGEVAMYNEENLFKRIRRNINYDSSIVADGAIDDKIHTYNCYSSLNHKKNKVTIVYGKKRKNKDMLHNKRQLQFAFVITLLDSYPMKSEFWGIEFKYYTKTYDLKISFDKENPPKNIGLYNVETDVNGKEILDKKGNPKLTPMEVDPLIMEKYGRVIMKIKLLHVNKGDILRVCWDWKKPKKIKKPS